MSQILRIKNNIVHIPSIARNKLTTTPFLKRPSILLQTYAGDVCIINYSRNDWKTAINDYTLIEASLSACQEALKDIPHMNTSSEEGSSQLS